MYTHFICQQEVVTLVVRATCYRWCTNQSDAICGASWCWMAVTGKTRSQVKSVVHFSSDGQNLFPPSKLIAIWHRCTHWHMRVQHVQKLCRIYKQIDIYRVVSKIFRTGATIYTAVVVAWSIGRCRTTISSESVCQVARSWVDVGSFHTLLFGVV